MESLSSLLEHIRIQGPAYYFFSVVLVTTITCALTIWFNWCLDKDRPCIKSLLNRIGSHTGFSSENKALQFICSIILALSGAALFSCLIWFPLDLYMPKRFELASQYAAAKRYDDAANTLYPLIKNMVEPPIKAVSDENDSQDDILKSLRLPQPEWSEEQPSDLPPQIWEAMFDTAHYLALRNEYERAYFIFTYLIYHSPNQELVKLSSLNVALMAANGYLSKNIKPFGVLETGENARLFWKDLKSVLIAFAYTRLYLELDGKFNQAKAEELLKVYDGVQGNIRPREAVKRHEHCSCDVVNDEESAMFEVDGLAAAINSYYYAELEIEEVRERINDEATELVIRVTQRLELPGLTEEPPESSQQAAGRFW